MFKLLLRDADRVVLVSQDREPFKTGDALNDLRIKEHYSVVVAADGLIAAVGPASAIEEKYPLDQFVKVVDCRGMTVLPGFVDAHTHALFEGDRTFQFGLKLSGKTYAEISAMGFGIKYTAKSIENATEDVMLHNLHKRVEKMTRLGTTALQIKSGYGFSAETQLKMLRVIEQLKREVPVEVVSTFLGAHVVPPGKTQAEQTQYILKEQLPRLKQAMSLGQVKPQFVDVFCQKGVFQMQSTRLIIEGGKAIGLLPNFHAEQLNYLQSGLLAAELGARAISHLEHLSSKAIKALAQTKTAGVLLPTTQHIQKLRLPPARQMVADGMIVALGSDFCPNAFCYSMPLTIHLACRNFGLLPNEAIVAATLNAAYSINRESMCGSIEVGKLGNFAILEGTEQRLAYQFGDNPLKFVVVRGEVQEIS